MTRFFLKVVWKTAKTPPVTSKKSATVNASHFSVFLIQRLIGCSSCSPL